MLTPHEDLHVKPYAKRHVKVYADTSGCLAGNGSPHLASWTPVTA